MLESMCVCVCMASKTFMHPKSIQFYCFLFFKSCTELGLFQKKKKKLGLFQLFKSIKLKLSSSFFFRILTKVIKIQSSLLFSYPIFSTFFSATSNNQKAKIHKNILTHKNMFWKTETRNRNDMNLKFTSKSHHISQIPQP